MNHCITPASLTGSLPAIASKSDLHRLLLCAALSDRPTTIACAGLSRDVRATLDCLSALGADIREQDDGLRVLPHPSPRRDTAAVLPCCESGSTLRFLLPIAAALGAPATFTGEGRLPHRPLNELLDCLAAHGIACRHPQDAALPLTLSGQLAPGSYTLPGNVSSQYITGLLFALPLLAGDSRIHLTSPLQSGGYVALTLFALSRFGVRVQRLPQGYAIPGGQTYVSPGSLAADGDWSNAAFWLCAGALGKPVTVTGLCRQSAQGDAKIAQLLCSMGAEVQWLTEGVRVSPAALRGIDINAAEIPDLIPVLAAVAAVARGTTRIYNAQRLRLKECDRLQATAQTLRDLGARVQETQDGLEICGLPQLRGGEVQSYGDHRMAMMAAVASIACASPVTVRGSEAVNKSYPSFWQDFARLGGRATQV